MRKLDMAKQISTYDIANAFTTHADYREKLVYSTGYNCFFYWMDGYYVRIERRDLKKKIMDFIAHNFPNKSMTSAIIDDTYKLIELSCLREVDYDDRGYLSFKDCLLNLNNFINEPFTKDKVITHRLWLNSTELGMLTPMFDNYLKTTLVDKKGETDEELILFAQEMFGFFLMDSMKGAGAFFLVGNGSNGKSVMTYLIQEMVGKEFCSAMSIQDLTTDKFSTVNLIGKKVNISNEEESKYMRSDKFKALVTGDLIAAEQKFGEKFEFKPSTKYVFASNELPTFDSMNYGLKRRIKILPFFRRFKDEEQDKELTTKLLLEMPGIVTWAIAGAKRFKENNYVFTNSKASRMALRAFESEVSSALRFIHEEYKLSEDNVIPHKIIYIAYQEWCIANGKKPVNSFKFFTDITRNIDGLASRSTRDEFGNTVQGKCLKSKKEKVVDDAVLPFGE